MNELADKLEVLADGMLKQVQVPLELTHVFATGVYWRELKIPAGTFVLGHKHKHECVNVMLTGRMRVLVGDSVKEIVAPQVFVTPAGSQKVAYVIEETRFANVLANPTNEMDINRIEDLMIEKSAAKERYLKEMSALGIL